MTATEPYSELVAILFANLPHAGALAPAVGVVRSEVGDRARGAQIRLWLQVSSGDIQRARFQAYGCPHFLAAAELMANWLEGKSLADARAWSSGTLEAVLQSPAEKRSKLLLLEDALHQALTTA